MMRKFWIFISALTVALALSACSTSETPVADFDAPPVPEEGEVQTQNFGFVSCHHPTGGWIRCLGLKYGDGFGHAEGHFERRWVKILQRRLNRRGFNAGTVDGKFGGQTLRAVERAQRKYKIGVDGDVGYCTWTSLFHNYRCR